MIKTLQTLHSSLVRRVSATIFRLLVLFVAGLSLLIGCGPTPEHQQAIAHYATDNQQSEYTQLVNRDPETLSTEQLYNRALTLWGPEYTELKVPTSYGLAQVVVSGPDNGYPVILLHGMKTNSTMWYPNAPFWAREYKVYAIDYLLTGGKSEADHGVEDVAQVLAWYREIFDALKLHDFALVGASQGGWFATQIALNEPSRVSKLVLLSAAQTFGWIEPSFDLLKNVFFSLNPERSELKAMLQTMSANVDNIDQLYIDQFFRYAATTAALPELVSEMVPFDDGQLSRLTMPTLVLIGDKDIVNSPASLARAKQFLPCVDTAIIANAGHFLSVDNAHSVNQLVHQFIGLTQRRSGC